MSAVLSLWPPIEQCRPLNHTTKQTLTKLEAFYRSPDNQKQTVQSEKRQPEWQDSNEYMRRQQYISMLLWTFGLKEDFLKGEALPLPNFCPTLDPPLGISCRNHYQNGSIPSKAFCLWSSLWLLAPPWIHPRVDLIKSLNTYAGHENFRELHPYQIS